MKHITRTRATRRHSTSLLGLVLVAASTLSLGCGPDPVLGPQRTFIVATPVNPSARMVAITNRVVAAALVAAQPGDKLVVVNSTSGAVACEVDVPSGPSKARLKKAARQMLALQSLQPSEGPVLDLLPLPQVVGLLRPGEWENPRLLLLGGPTLKFGDTDVVPDLHWLAESSMTSEFGTRDLSGLHQGLVVHIGFAAEGDPWPAERLQRRSAQFYSKYWAALGATLCSLADAESVAAKRWINVEDSALAVSPDEVPLEDALASGPPLHVVPEGAPSVGIVSISTPPLVVVTEPSSTPPVIVLPEEQRVLVVRELDSAPAPKDAPGVTYVVAWAGGPQCDVDLWVLAEGAAAEDELCFAHRESAAGHFPRDIQSGNSATFASDWAAKSELVELVRGGGDQVFLNLFKNPDHGEVSGLVRRRDARGVQDVPFIFPAGNPGSEATDRATRSSAAWIPITF